MNESNTYRALAMSTAVFGGFLMLLGWIAGGGGLIIRMNVLSASFLVGGAALMAFGPWFVLFHYQDILRGRREA